MRAVIVSGGTVAEYDAIQKEIRPGDMVICADSGYHHAVKMGVKADLVVGDFDSIGRVPSDVPAVRYPAEKDLTDTELALEHARAAGAHEFLILAGTGGRIDHTLANILLLRDCIRRGESAEIVDEHSRIMITESALRFRGQEGALVSLIPLSDCGGVTTAHLAYPLLGAALRMGTGLGVSNLMTADEAAVSLESGTLLVILTRDAQADS